MEVYRYKAMNDQGRMLQGKVDAINPADLEVRLSRLGLDLVNYKEMKSKQQNITGRGIKRTDLITFCFHLEHLVRAGVPILEGLSDLRDSIDNKRLREVTAAMIESIEGGKNLSGAMEDFPFVFNKVFVSLVHAGEQSGQLGLVLEKIIENLKWQDEQAAHTKKLLMYPSLVAIVVLTVVIFLLVYVVPQLTSFLSTMGQELPLQTKILIACSDFLRSYWFIVIPLPILAIFGVWFGVVSNPKFAEKMDGLMLKIPVVGPILKKIIITRVCNVFSIMYSSGITVLECIRTTEDVAGNKAVQRAVREAGRMIADGGGISHSFAETGLFPPLVVRMLRVGENTGALEQALGNVTYFYTRDVRESIGNLQAMIMPGITIVLGGIILWIMSSVLGPIYDLFTQIQF